MNPNMVKEFWAALGKIGMQPKLWVNFVLHKPAGAIDEHEWKYIVATVAESEKAASDLSADAIGEILPGETAVNNITIKIGPGMTKTLKDWYIQQGVSVEHAHVMAVNGFKTFAIEYRALMAKKRASIPNVPIPSVN